MRYRWPQPCFDRVILGWFVLMLLLITVVEVL